MTLSEWNLYHWTWHPPWIVTKREGGEPVKIGYPKPKSKVKKKGSKR
jgi:hypothetical protein